MIGVLCDRDRSECETGSERRVTGLSLALVVISHHHITSHHHHHNQPPGLVSGTIFMLEGRGVGRLSYDQVIQD